jgi:outer membrane protein insertion porin family
MTIDDPGNPLLPSSTEQPRHSARERQRRGPMWGCLRTMLLIFIGVVILLLLVIGVGWWYVGTLSFAEMVRLRVEQTLESRLGREVTIGRVEIIRSRPQRVILRDLRIANAPGGAAPDFALVREVEITGGVESFWTRHVRVSRVDIRGPHIWFEVMPEGAPVTHNFPIWKPGVKRRFEIYRLDIGRLFISGGEFSFNDRRRDLVAVATNIDSEVAITRAEGMYEGIMQSPLVRVRLQEYEPFDVDMRGGFRYTPGTLAIQSVALRGRGIEAFVAGKIEPLTKGVYDLRITSRVGLDRVREIFRLEQPLEGTVALDTRLRGAQGDFEMTGGWSSPRISASPYDLTDARGTLTLDNDDLRLQVERAGYGGGTISADYALTQFREPYPMNVELRYNTISIEQLFSDWGLQNTGLRGAATGKLTYGWNKDRILDGAGQGSARLTRSVAFSGAPYPVPLAGSTDFALDRGVVTFRRADLETESSNISLAGTLRIEDIVMDLRTTIRSRDFGELDRIGVNFARATDNADYDLLGLGGSGTITGTIRGPIAAPDVVARIVGNDTLYNNVLLGDSDIELRYQGSRDLLTFDRALFIYQGGSLVLTGTVLFPDRGPGPRFDIALEASGYPAQRAIDAIGLDLAIGPGLATGRMVIAGTPESGRATFAGLTIRRAEATLALDGSVRWLPGEGNVEFDLQIAAKDFPVSDITAFLDLDDVPVTGALTGELRISGTKRTLEGAGRVTIREGAIYGEPVEVATADIAFTRGRMRATDIVVQTGAGEIRGEAELDFATERFSYEITSTSIDLARLEIFAKLRNLFGGNITLRSFGAGTFEEPELTIEATLHDAELPGLELPAGAEAPSLYIAIRGGRLIIRGQVAGIIEIDGEGTVGENLAVDALVQVRVLDLGRALALSPRTATLPATGSLVLDMRLGGRLSPLEALVVEATAPVFDVQVAGHEFTTPEPLRLTLRNGRIEVDSFALVRSDSTFSVTGFAELTGAKRLDLDVRGRIEAVLLQLFMPDTRADGLLDLAMTIDGTTDTPRMHGSAEVRNGQIRFGGFPQLIDQINGTLNFEGDIVKIESLRATVGGGTVYAGGDVRLEGLKPVQARVTLVGDGVALRYYEGVTIEGDFELVLTSDFEGAVLQGNIYLTRGLYFRDFDLQQALLNVILARDRITPITETAWQDRLALDIRLEAPRGTLAIRNNIADVTGSAGFDVTGTLARPIVLGEITLDEGGSLRFQNIDYRVVRGTVAFQNPFRIDPFFDVTIEGSGSGFGSDLEGGRLQITVNLTGTLDRLTPTITSDPPASDITLFSILGFGGLGSREAAQQAGGVGLLGQSILYQSLSTLIGSRVFPFVDAFTYDPGNLEAGSGSGPRVTFEKRLSSTVRFLLVYNLANNQNREVIEWLVSPDWTLQLVRDMTGDYRIDARFRRRYEAHWRMRDETRDFARAAVMVGAGEAAAGAQKAAALPAALPTAPIPPVTDVDVNFAQDRPITRIRFRADAPFDTAALQDEVSLQPGEFVTIRALQSSIKNLFATGSFRDIRVDAEQAEDGVILTFALFLNYRVGIIEIEGLRRADRTRSRRVLTLRTGEILSLDNVDDNALAIEEMLHRYGYLEAVVDPQTTFDRERSIADVTFEVTPGPQAKVAEVILEGDLSPFTREQLIGRMARRPGRTFNLLDARSDAERMETYLIRADHRRARVAYLDHTYDPASSSVTLRYSVNVGPEVRVAVSGVPRSMVRRWLPFARNQAYSEDVIDRAVTRMIEGLQERGHYQATVDTESSPEDNLWTTTFHVDPGPRFRLADVAFRGNRQVSDNRLNNIVEVTPRGGFRRFLQNVFRRPSGVTRQQLAEDRTAIESFYRLNGFSDATVATPVVEARADGTLRVEFPITEGPQTIVTDLRIEGPETFSLDELPAQRLRVGEPLNPQLLQEDVIRLQTFYADRGHVEVQVAPRVEMSQDRTSATLTFTITEGPQVDIDDLIVRGNTYTDREVILRKSGLESGEPFTYTSMLEAQRELYRLGIFQRVDVIPQTAGTTPGERDIVLQVEEGRNLTLTGAVGLRIARSTDEGRGTEFRERIAGAAAHRNLFGTGRYLGFEAVYSGDVEQEAFLTYREPFVSRWNIPVQFQIFQSDDSTRRGTRILQRGTSIEATRVARLQTRWSLRYEYKISECAGGDLCAEIRQGLPVEDLDRSLLNIQISSITPTFFWDRRDDIIDPRRGFFTSASVEYAFPSFSADANFLREYVQGAWYRPVSSRTVIAVSGRVGLIQPLGGTDHRDVPLSERFTAGGENSHRAFALDRLGDLCLDRNGARIPDCQPTLFRRIDPDTLQHVGPILPRGGSAMLLINAEYRFPLFSTVGGAIFADAGNVWADDTIRFNSLRYGVGVGIRYFSPVGPLRFDIGMPLDRRHYEPSFQYFITLGHAF